ncbi:MAG: hypothetical protein ACREP7_05810 [Lysobacter sp.]
MVTMPMRGGFGPLAVAAVCGFEASALDTGASAAAVLEAVVLAEGVLAAAMGGAAAAGAADPAGAA